MRTAEAGSRVREEMSPRGAGTGGTAAAAASCTGTIGEVATADRRETGGRASTCRLSIQPIGVTEKQSAFSSEREPKAKP